MVGDGSMDVEDGAGLEGCLEGGEKCVGAEDAC